MKQDLFDELEANLKEALERVKELEGGSCRFDCRKVSKANKEIERITTENSRVKDALAALEIRHGFAVDAWNREIDRNKALVSDRQQP